MLRRTKLTVALYAGLFLVPLALGDIADLALAGLTAKHLANIKDTYGDVAKPAGTSTLVPYINLAKDNTKKL